MSSESYRAQSGINEPGITGMPRFITSERVAAPETPLPVRGDSLGEVWGAYSGNFVLDAVDQQRGGQRFHVVVHCSPPDWYELFGSERNRELGVSVPYKQEVVPTPDPGVITADPMVEYTPINEALSLKRTTIAPIDALDAYFVSLPTQANLRIPPVLVSVIVEWNESSGVGEHASNNSGADTREYYSLGASESASASSSAGLIPSVRPVIREYESDGIPSTTHYFFMPLPVTRAQILARLGALAWPVFKPEPVTIVLKGVKKSVQARIDASASKSHYQDGDSLEITVGKGSDYDVSLSNTTETIRPTIHGSISLSGQTSRSATINATAEIGWTGTNFPAVSESKSASSVVAASVSPATIPATSPSSVPSSGTYLIFSKVETYDFGYVMVVAETINASVLS